MEFFKNPKGSASRGVRHRRRVPANTQELSPLAGLQRSLAFAEAHGHFVYTVAVEYRHVEDVVGVVASSLWVPQLNYEAEVFEARLLPVLTNPSLFRCRQLVLYTVNDLVSSPVCDAKGVPCVVSDSM